MEEFIQCHMAALESNEARHNLILGLLARAASDPTSVLHRWSLGPPGACAIQNPGRPIVLGELDEQQCHRLAEQVWNTDFPGVVGPDKTAGWFVVRARELGIAFVEPVRRRIHAIFDAPRYPGAAGAARAVTLVDRDLFGTWLEAFFREAVPHDPIPAPEQIERTAGGGQYLFWTLNNEPVSMAGIVRLTKSGAAIAGVYTPPTLRGRGYAGSATAALVERIYAEGRSFACLYTDLDNPYSNRCYAKVGFKPVCAAFHYPRAVDGS
jgi:GNAT superfamily N-acetyltransferase